MHRQENFIQTASRILLSAPIKQFYKRSVYLGNVLSLFVYVSIRLMLHDFPFEIIEETLFIIRIFLASCCIAGLCVGGFTLLMFIADNAGLIAKKILQQTFSTNKFYTKRIHAENLVPHRQPTFEPINM